MKAPKIQPVLYKPKTYKNGKHPIMIRLTQFGKPKYIALTDSVFEENWDCDQYRVYEKKPVLSQKQKDTLNADELRERKNRFSKAIVPLNAKSINQRITNLLDQINEVIKSFEVNKIPLTSENIIERIKKGDEFDEHSNSFIKYALNEVNDKIGQNHITYKNYHTAVNKFIGFLNDKLHKKDLKFSELSKEVLDKYSNHLKSTGIKINTIWSDFKIIQALTNKAIKLNLLSPADNPFIFFKNKSERTEKTRLTSDEIDKIINIDIEIGSSLWHIRNYFLFSYYNGGIRISDICQLRWRNISKERLTYSMDKTGTLKSFVLLESSKIILDFYSPNLDDPDKFIFPILSELYDYKTSKVLKNQISSKNTIINKGLKEIAKLAKIENTISFHVSRHSFADGARKRGIDIYQISKILGHTNIKITEGYLASFDLDAQDDAMRKMFS